MPPASPPPAASNTTNHSTHVASNTTLSSHVAPGSLDSLAAPPRDAHDARGWVYAVGALVLLGAAAAAARMYGGGGGKTLRRLKDSCLTSTPLRRLRTLVATKLRPSPEPACTEVELRANSVRFEASQKTLRAEARARVQPAISEMRAAASARTSPVPLLRLLYMKYVPRTPSLTLEMINALPDEPSKWRKPLLLAMRDFHPDKNDDSNTEAHDNSVMYFDPLEWSVLCLAATQLLGEKHTAMRKPEHTFDD